MLLINEIDRLDLGIQGENAARTIMIDCNAWQQNYPGCVISCLHKRNGEDVAGVTGATYDSKTGILSWSPTSYDTTYAGNGVATIRLQENDVVKKTIDLVTIVHPSVTMEDGTPVASNWQGYINAVERTKHAVGAESEAWAVGKRGGQDVPEDDETYHNNSKYYAEKIAGDLAEVTRIAEAAREAIQAILDANIVEEVAKGLVHSVNGVRCDSDGNVPVDTVDYARNLVSDDTQTSVGEFIERTTGGDASLSDGSAWLTSISGGMIHTGYTPESITMNVIQAEREAEEGEEEPEGISATLDRDTFVSYVTESGIISLTYDGTQGQWSASPALYGITVTGTPVDGDEIRIVYVKEIRGTITMASPSGFISTGWNLYQHDMEYAHVLKYSDTYGFGIDGAYTSIEYSATVDGEHTPITVTDGRFTVPADGYVWVTGGSEASTAIWMTWSDWTNGYEGTLATYTSSVLDLTDIMENFPAGLCQIGSVRDVIDFGQGMAVSYIERLDYTAANLSTVQESGREYDVDEDYIYAVREIPVSYTIVSDRTYAVNDHGMEILTGTTVPCYVSMLYGDNLVDKLRHDIPAQIAKMPPLEISFGTISSLPATVTNSKITDTMVCLPGNCLIGTPAAQTGDWTITTSNGSVTLSGTISGSTAVTVWLTDVRT